MTRAELGRQAGGGHVACLVRQESRGFTQTSLRPAVPDSTDVDLD